MFRPRHCLCQPQSLEPASRRDSEHVPSRLDRMHCESLAWPASEQSHGDHSKQSGVLPHQGLRFGSPLRVPVGLLLVDEEMIRL